MMSRRSLFIVLLIGFAVVLLSASIKTTLQVFFIDMATSFNLSRGQFAIAASVFMLAAGIASPIVGYIADRIGPKKTIIMGILVAGVMFFAGAFNQNFWLFVFMYGVLGAFSFTAMSFVPMGVLVDQTFSERWKGLAYAIMTNGTAVAFIVLSPLWIYSQQWFTWQDIYFFLGLVFIIPLFSIVQFAFRPETQAQQPDQPQHDTQGNFALKFKLVMSYTPFYVLVAGFFGCGVTMAFIDVHLVAHL